VALCGVALESNAFAPVATEADFRGFCYLEGDAVTEAARTTGSTASTELGAFVRTMDATGEWTPVPLVFTWCQPWGPVEHDFFTGVVESLVQGIRDAGGVDAVYVASHGAMVSTGSHDPDGDLLARLREAVGEAVPVLATLDLHANISARMVEAASVLVGYQTNPHVDMFERGEEAAHALRAMLAGNAAPCPVLVRLPITPPTVSLLTREGPYADLIDYGQRRKRELAGAILNVSVFGGFVFGDTPKNGIAVVVTGRHEEAPARRLAREIAERAWADRARFRCRLTSLDEAVAAAVANGRDPGRPARIFSDAGDNPGGGGGGDTIELLQALVEADARGVLFGSFHDPELAAAAVAAGEGGRLRAVFNAQGRTRFATRYEVDARVLAIAGRGFVGRLGIYAGRGLEPQPTCALEIGGPGGITVVVLSRRYQTADPMFFEHLGIDIAAARTVCVKSRGHFRAGFEPWFTPEQVVEVDTAGFTSPVLERFDWKHLPRPVYPLDEDTDWVPPNG
jgi:microcystin degradation protein MlrC